MNTGDPELDRIIAELQAQFRARTAEEMPLIEQHWAALRTGVAPRANAQALRRIVHRMAGSAGSFGYASVSDAATPLEAALATGLEEGDAELVVAAQSWAPLVEALLAACRAL
jgi:HPt (histidine-containing phosphotransfer) domain-containing protein